MVDERYSVFQSKEQFTETTEDCSCDHTPFKKTRKEKITDLNKLQPGDHISFYKTDFYYAHHGIVCESRTNYLRVIHYFNTYEHVCAELMKGSLYVAEVTESEWPVDLKNPSEDMYLHHYDNIPCFTNEETLQRAFSELGKRGYSLFRNNCEHWARWCRTGEHYSEQVYKLRKLVKKKSATLLVIDPVALLVKDVALVGAHTFGQFLSAVGSGVILTAVEGVSAFNDINKQNNKRKKGTLSNVALKKYVVRRITSASGTVIGGTVGTVVGTILIPVPILGAAVGGIIGTVSGKLLGGVSGIALSKIVDVYEKRKALEIMQMSTVPLLINNLSVESEILRGLMNIALEPEEEEQISTFIQQTMNSNSSSVYPTLEEFARQISHITLEKCEVATKLTTELFTDSNSYDYFVLTPVPDENAPEEFASSMDLLVLRWSMETIKPWEAGGEQVLDIDDLNSNKE